MTPDATKDDVVVWKDSQRRGVFIETLSPLTGDLAYRARPIALDDEILARLAALERTLTAIRLEALRQEPHENKAFVLKTLQVVIPALCDNALGAPA